MKKSEFILIVIISYIVIILIGAFGFGENKNIGLNYTLSCWLLIGLFSWWVFCLLNKYDYWEKE